MAKIKFGALAEDARGKIGGVVYSRNQFGGYIREKVSPVQPSTARQTIVRERVTTITKRWFDTLTDAERLAWIAFAKVTPVPDVFGNPNLLTGINAYLRLNGVLLNAVEAIIDTPPANLASVGLETASVAMASGAGTAAVTFTLTPTAGTDRLYLWATQGLTAGRFFFKPFYRFLGVSTIASASPFAAGTLYTDKFGTMIVGSAVGWKIQVVRNTNGAVTSGLTVRSIVAA